jgi:hypothetical protein
MKDISYHILDIVNNSLHAGASLVIIDITEDNQSGEYKLTIEDNGRGIPEDMLETVTDPFITSSLTKKVGMGLPLLKQNAELTRGTLTVESDLNKGTIVRATFLKNHIDMLPEGDIALTLRTLVAAGAGVDYLFRYKLNEKQFAFDTMEIRRELGEDIPLNSVEVLRFITDYINGQLTELKIKAGN